MKTSLQIIRAFGILLMTLLVYGCQSPTSNSSNSSSNGTKGLTINWSLGSSKAKTILPSSYPKPVSYNVSLQPSSGSATTKTGLTETSWNISDLAPGVYTVTVTGLDSSGKTLVTGVNTIDTSSNFSNTIEVDLNYITTGTGTGGISLDFSFGVGTTFSAPTITLVDPSGKVTSPTATTNGNGYTYTNNSAAVGSYQVFVKDNNGSQTAMKFEYLLVVQGVTTTGTMNFVSTDYTANYVAVTGLTLNKNVCNTEASGQTDSLTATLSPSTASNSAIVWSSSNTDVATVTQAGVVSLLGAGGATVTITATSVDNAKASAGCVYTLVSNTSVVYNANGATSGSVPVDTTSYADGSTVTVLGNTGSLSYSGYVFAGWTTNPNTSGVSSSYAAGATFIKGTSVVALYAIWIPSKLNFSSNGTTITITGYSTAPSGSLVIPAGVTAIGTSAFNSNDMVSLTSVSFPSSVTNIGAEAFEAAGLNTLVLPGNLKTIGSVAFNGVSIGTVTIPASVTSIGDGAFSACMYLKSINVDAANTSFKSISGVLYNNSGTTLLQYPGGLSGAFTVPSGVTSIEGLAFFNALGLTAVTIPASVSSIGEMAFGDCQYLASATIQATTPPTITQSGPFSDEASNFVILVPTADLATYKNADYWSTYASEMVGD